MSNNKSYTLPQWLDKIIFDDFQAIYEPSPSEVVYNPDQPYDFVKLYLGTYFPRSYAEAYGIISHLLSFDKFRQHYIELEEVNLLDFCCGTGGELVGTICALQSHLPNLQRVNVDAFDANPDAIRFLYHLSEAINRTNDMRVIMNINPQCIFIEAEREIDDIVNLTNVQYHFMMSFKAINEFVQHKTFDTNAYELVATKLFQLMSQYGVFIMTDVSRRLNDSNLFYPQVMNKGLNNFLRSSSLYKSIIPAACFHHENNCPGCYMQDTFYVSHSKKSHDASKVVYRVVCKSDFANEIMSNSTPCQCRATNQFAEKNLPYNNICH